MKLEILEKVGEVILVELRSAEDNHEIATLEQEKQKEQALVRKAEQERKNKVRAVEILTTLAEVINSEAERGHTNISLSWHRDNPSPHGISVKDWENCGECVKGMLALLGYSCEVYWYSTAWQKKSGKIGWVTIRW
jgi:hypothetical protein